MPISVEPKVRPFKDKRIRRKYQRPMDQDDPRNRMRRPKQRRLPDPRPRGMVVGAAVSAGRGVKKNKEKIKKKIKDIGNMKVKDAAKKIASGIGALTPIGIGKRIGEKIKGPQPRAPKNIREKIRKGKIRPIPMPKIPKMSPLGKMKKQGPRPGSFAYQQQQTLKPGYKVAPMLTGGQAKIAAKAPPTNKIDGKDFAVLRAEKAKGRGMGLQDEKMKPGKIMKADKGKMIKGDSTKPINPMDKGMKKRMAERALRAARATTIGKIALGVAAVGLGAKEYLKRRSRKKRERDAVRRLKEDAAVKKLQEGVGKVKKKMGGGMMMQRPMGNYMGGGLTEATQRLKAQGKMGGGMMMRPNPVGMKAGKSVKVKCKIGRNKPTKMY